MQEMTSSEIHDVEISLLEHAHAFCTERGLRYFLAYGTLLGAIRHKGFIPWDDDADIWLPRSDYDTLIRAYVDSDRYSIVRPFSRDYGFAWAKIVDKRTAYTNTHLKMPDSYGLSLDIFPLDEDRGARRYSLAKRASMLRRVKWRVPLEPDSSLKGRVKRLARPLIPSFLIDERGYAMFSKGIGEADSYVNYCSKYSYQQESLLKSWFGKGQLVPFEGEHKFIAPDCPDEILSSLYGQEWQTPVVATHESATVYWR